ncbi:MAG: hypothetical protein JXO22_02460, partial [Phycisphaerae bacterium]|nr:hypothetical protein [Phycisphaerae bacterium]
YRHAALLALPAAWLLLTLGPWGCAVFIGGVLAGAAWVVLLGTLRRRKILSRRQMIALVWIGLNLMILPVWWKARWWWYGWPDPDFGASRLAALHPIGFAYVLLRLIAWGVDWAGNPGDRLRLRDTLCWLFYPPGLRNGPFMLRDAFMQRLDAWQPRNKVPWGKVLKHLGWALLGLAGLVVASNNLPKPLAVDFFTAPEMYDTNSLLRAFYILPVVIYCFLYGYNEIALAAAHWVGISVDTNFINVPLATSPRDFWRRWNVTVGDWIRKYIYIPLGGKYAFAPLVYLISFGYCGVWHGAAWGYVGWPVIQMVALSIQRQWDRFRTWRGWRDMPPSKPWIVVCWLLTMHCQLLTVFVFADFHHMGLLLMGELWKRLLQSLTGVLT